MDYLVADPIVTPPELCAMRPARFSEALALLPPSYQPQSNRQPFPMRMAPMAGAGDGSGGSGGDKGSDRGEGGRAGGGGASGEFVFACFNNNNKIEPIIFAAWMEVLRQVRSIAPARHRASRPPRFAQRQMLLGWRPPTGSSYLCCEGHYCLMAPFITLGQMSPPRDMAPLPTT